MGRSRAAGGARVQCRAWQVWVRESGGSGAGGGRVAKSRVVRIVLANGVWGRCWRVGAVGKAVAHCRAWQGWMLESGGSGAGGGSRKNSWCRSVGGLGVQCGVIAGWRTRVSVAGVGWWPVSQCVAMDRCRACCLRASGVQRAVWSGAVLRINRSVLERWIIGLGGAAGVGGADGCVDGRVSEFLGLSRWVGGGCCVVVVDNTSGGSGVSRKG